MDTNTIVSSPTHLLHLDWKNEVTVFQQRVILDVAKVLTGSLTTLQRHMAIFLTQVHMRTTAPAMLVYGQMVVSTVNSLFP